MTIQPDDRPAMEDPESAAPLFCPHCRKTHPQRSWFENCRACGLRLLSQGYCPVCEDYWQLPVGAICPKHDLKLEEEGPRLAFWAAGDRSRKWVTVAHLNDSQAAESLRIRLEAEDIPTFVDGERMGSRSMYPIATGGVRLKVPEDLAAEARIILSQTWSATAAELGLDTNDDDWDSELWHEPPQSSLGRNLWLGNQLAFFLMVGLPTFLLMVALLLRRLR
ncbi:MAG: hypothetical protein ACLP7Q_26925 [Isosphaeraceae bacterium]